MADGQSGFFFVSVFCETSHRLLFSKKSKANNKFSKQQSLIKVYKIQGFTLNPVNSRLYSLKS